MHWHISFFDQSLGPVFDGRTLRDELLCDPSQLGVAVMASRAVLLNEIKSFVNLVVTQAIIESLAVR